MAQRNFECCSPTRSETGKQWTLVSLGLLTFAFAVASIRTCNFISLASDGDNQADLATAVPVAVQGLGIFQSADENGQCQDYADRAGGAHAMAKAFGLLAVFSIGAAVLSTLAALLVLRNQKNRAALAWHTARALFAGGLYSVLFTFFLYGSTIKKELCVDGTECKAGPGAIITAINAVLTAVLAILAMLTAAPQSPLLNADTRDKNKSTADEEYAFGNVDAAVSSDNSTNKTRGGGVGGGWFSTKGSKVAAGGAAAVVTTAAVVVASKKRTNKSRSSNNVVNAKVEQGVVVDEEAKDIGSSAAAKKRSGGWFGSKDKVVAVTAGGAAVATGSSEAVIDDKSRQRSLFRNKMKEPKSQRTKAVVDVVGDNTISAPPLASSEKRGWFGSSNGKVATTAAEPKRAGLAQMLRPRVADETSSKKVDPAKTAETRMELFGLDETDFADVYPTCAVPEPAANKKTSKRAVAENSKKEKTVTVVNESVGSSCPPCYCLP